MALNGTMVKIETVTVGSGGQAAITFSSIPQTYTDLRIVTSCRSTASAVAVSKQIKFNGSSSNLSSRRLFGSGSSTTSDSFASNLYIGIIPGATATASTFSNDLIYIPNYTGSTNKSVSADSVSENNATEAYQALFAGLWSNTAAITSIELSLVSGNFAQYSTATLYGISKTTSQIKATGGMVYEIDGYVYHLFNESGTFTPTQNLTVDYLVVAGGGGGAGPSAGGGGGGAGGMRCTVDGTGGSGSLESPLSLSANTGYTVTVGAGGAGVTQSVYSTTRNNGSNSVFSTITSTGGGGGAGGNIAGANGGSGGGGNGGYNTSGGTASPSGQGFNGGNGTGALYPPGIERYGAGGGGGASAVGGNGSTSSTTEIAGNGGAGRATSITGSSVTYAGGGGGSVYNSTGTAGSGGSGGGGAGVKPTSGTNPISGTSGTANTGGGGGGAGGYNGSTSASGGNGGSGVVIVRYAK